MVNMAALKNTKHKHNDAYETGIGTQFNAETNKRDEDEEMYVYMLIFVLYCIEYISIILERFILLYCIII